MVRSTHCFFRGHRFHSQHSSWYLTDIVISDPEDPMPSSDLSRYQAYTYIHESIHAQRDKINY